MYLAVKNQKNKVYVRVELKHSKLGSFYFTVPPIVKAGVIINLLTEWLIK